LYEIYAFQQHPDKTRIPLVRFLLHFTLHFPKAKRLYPRLSEFFPSKLPH